MDAPPSYDQVWSNNGPTDQSQAATDDKKRPPSDEKSAYTGPQAAQPQPAMAAGPSGSASGQPEIVFHIYKDPSMFSRDDIVTGPDKETVLYTLDFPHRLSGRWHMTLHRGPKGGPPVCTIDRDWLANLSISMPNGWKTPFTKTAVVRHKREFLSFDGKTRYRWEPNGLFTSGYTCTNTVNNDEIASWRATNYAITKDGTLTINPRYAPEAELILATALALEEVNRENRQESR